jgi:hypothetical protein
VYSANKNAHAITHVPQTAESDFIEPKYRFTKSSSITFCPAFFDDNQFPNLETIIGQHGTQGLTLDKVECAERVLLHEYMHLGWIDNLNPDKDDIGYQKVAQRTQWARSFKEIVSLPDVFAWYALYSYFNNVDGGCGDAWPLGEAKPVVFQ